MTLIKREAITGLVLAGGAGRRMGKIDKGLQPWGSGTLTAHALSRLRPQTDRLAISANRHLQTYAALGVPVWSDTSIDRSDLGGLEDFPGPLAGMLAGLRHCATPWLITVPCDCPFFPENLVPRLYQAATAARTLTAIATAPDCDNPGKQVREAVFCLLHRSLADALATYLRGGGRKIWHWLQPLGCAEVAFADAGAFININTPEELAASLALSKGQPHES